MESKRVCALENDARTKKLFKVDVTFEGFEASSASAISFKAAKIVELRPECFIVTLCSIGCKGVGN